MMSSEVSYQWYEHQGSLMKEIGNLWDNLSFADCTLAAEGQYIKAHRLIMSACSPYFQSLFIQEHERNPIIILKDVRFQDLKSIIDFIYYGEVHVPRDCVRAFLNTARDLQIRGLTNIEKEIVEQRLGKSLRSEYQILESQSSHKKSRTCQTNTSYLDDSSNKDVLLRKDIETISPSCVKNDLKSSSQAKDSSTYLTWETVTDNCRKGLPCPSSSEPQSFWVTNNQSGELNTDFGGDGLKSEYNENNMDHDVENNLDSCNTLFHPEYEGGGMIVDTHAYSSSAPIVSTESLESAKEPILKNFLTTEKVFKMPYNKESNTVSHCVNYSENHKQTVMKDSGENFKNSVDIPMPKHSDPGYKCFSRYIEDISGSQLDSILCDWENLK